MEKKSPRTKVRVAVRVRPKLQTEAVSCVLPQPSKKSVQIINHRNLNENLQYDFSSVYDHSATQHDIFSECVQPYLKHSFEGQNVSIFAYGPTGAGKTHTMLGLASDPGIIPRVIKDVFQTIHNEKSKETPSKKAKSDCPQTTITFSYLEIYNEKVRDLLVSGSSDLPIREDAKHNIFVAGLKEEAIDSYGTFKTHFGPACNNRTVAATKLNEHSSRSHSILMLKIHRRIQGKQFIGKIYLIDLAGSEDNRRTGNKGIRLKESGAINKSLFVLGEVVDAINNNSARIPYRNSKLTRLLQDSIGGNCFSVMLTNIAPEKHYYYDTYCTLNFASKSKKIVNVNTTTCIDESVPAQVTKPVVALKPNKNERSKDATSIKEQTIAPVESLPSPLVRRQNDWETAANQRILELERQLKKHLTKIRRSTQSSQPLGSSSLHDQTFVISSDLPTSPSGKSESSDSSPVVILQTPDCSKRSQALTDKSNLLYHGANRDRSLLKRVLDSGPSCSPLFPDSPPVAKKKRAQKRSNKDNDVKEKSTTMQLLEQLSSQNQAARGQTFLEIMNSGTTKELQQLQTVGVKRAKLIFEYRELHGKFEEVNSLRQVPGFTQKYMENLLRSNLISS